MMQSTHNHLEAFVSIRFSRASKSSKLIQVEILETKSTTRGNVELRKYTCISSSRQPYQCSIWDPVILRSTSKQHNITRVVAVYGSILYCACITKVPTAHSDVLKGEPQISAFL